MFTVSTKKPGRPYRHGDLRAAMIEAGLGLLEEAGEADLSLREAARRAGVSAMAPYRHFKDKAALLDAIALRGFELLGEVAEQADQAPSPVAALARQGAAYVAFACHHAALFELMFVRIKPASPDAIHAHGRAYRVLAERVATLRTDVVVEDLVIMAWSFVHGLAALILNHRLGQGPEPTEQMVERVTRQFASFVAGAPLAADPANAGG